MRGEHELVSMASEQLRKLLRSSGVRFREEEDAPTTTSWVAPGRESSSSVAKPEDSDSSRDSLREGQSRARRVDHTAYGEYPTLPGAARAVFTRSRRSHDLIRDAATRHALEKFERDEDFGFSRAIGVVTPRERRLLAFHRALHSGISFYRLGLVDDAMGRLREAVRLRRESGEAHHYLGLVYDQMGRLDDAERHLRRAVRSDPEVGATHFYLANVYQKRGRLELAVAEYKAALAQDPGVPIIYNNLAWVLYQSGDFEHAARAFEETISMEPDLPFPHNGLGCVHQDTGSYIEAVDEFRKATELYPEYSAAHLKLGWCYLQIGNLPAAILAFQAVLNTSEEAEYVASAWYSLGHAHLALGDLEEAAEAFQHVVASDDEEFWDAYLRLGVIRLRLGDPSEAMDLLRRYVRKCADEDAAEAYKYLAQGSLELERYSAATRFCRMALRKDPHDADVYELLGQVAGHQGHWGLARRHLERALRLAPQSASAYEHLGWVHESCGESHLAEDAYKNAIQRSADDTDAYLSLAWLYVKQGKRDEALVIFEKALELSPDDTNLLNSLAWLNAREGLYDVALRHYRRGLEVDPESSLLRCNVGTVYFQMGRLEDAERELDYALRLDSDPVASANARYYLGLLARGRGDFANAVTLLQGALKAAPEMAAAWYRLGECWLHLGALRRSRQAFDRYLAMEPEGEFAAEARQAVLEKLSSVTEQPDAAALTAVPRVRARRTAGSVSPSSASRPARASGTRGPRARPGG